MNDDNLNACEETHKVIGQVVSRLLKPGETLPIHTIVDALHHLALSGCSENTRLACLNAIRILLRKMH